MRARAALPAGGGAATGSAATGMPVAIRLCNFHIRSMKLRQILDGTWSWHLLESTRPASVRPMKPTVEDFQPTRPWVHPSDENGWLDDMGAGHDDAQHGLRIRLKQT